MTPEANKAIVRRHIEEVFMGGHVELIDGYYVPDGSTPELVSPQEWRERVLWWHKAAPGFKLTILDIFAEGDKVMVHFQADVTYSNPMDPPPAWVWKQETLFCRLTTWPCVGSKIIVVFWSKF